MNRQYTVKHDGAGGGRRLRDGTSDVRALLRGAALTAALVAAAPIVQAQADATRTSTNAFLDQFRMHVARGDALRARRELLAPATDASAKLAAHP